MRGHIVKRYRGSYTIVLNLGVDPSTGRRRQQWVSVRGTKKDAERKLAELLHQLDTGTFIKPGRVTVSEFLERWLKDYVWPNLSPRTAEGYEHIIRQHLMPGIGNMLLTQLKPEHIQHYYKEKLTKGRCDGKGGLSPRTVRHHHVTLHTALEGAVRWGLLARNVADAVSAPRYQRSEVHTLDEGEVRLIVETARGTPYYALFYLALFTGMRRSELLALRWEDVDLVFSQVSVTRTLHRLRDSSIVFRGPKSGKGRRLVALPPSAAVALKGHREEQETMGTLLGRTLGDGDLVFSQPDGGPLLPDTVTQAWVRLVRRVGLRGIRLHDARHTHASLLLKQGVHPKIVQERLGHSSIQITLDTYSHVAPGLQEAAAVRFDEWLGVGDKSGAKSEVGENTR